MNTIPSFDRTEVIETALAARWALTSPNPRFVTQLERTLVTAAEDARGHREAARSGFTLIRLPAPGWLAIGVAITAIVAGIWFSIRSIPTPLESVTATPAITMTSTLRASLGSIAAPVVTLRPTATPSPVILAPHSTLAQTAPALALLGPGSSAFTARAPRPQEIK